MRHPIVFLAEMMVGVMYLHQVLRQPDSREFDEAVIKEVNGHVDNDLWKLIHVLKYQKARRLYHQYGKCEASKT